nr:MAG TPA: hypothetical protein [Caudoviricetes sp.]
MNIQIYSDNLYQFSFNLVEVHRYSDNLYQNVLI